VCVEVVGNVKKLQISKAVAKQRDGWLSRGMGGKVEGWVAKYCRGKGG
jgi:hypothetical protein